MGQSSSVYFFCLFYLAKQDNEEVRMLARKLIFRRYTCPKQLKVKTSSAISLCEVTSLDHKVFDHSVELAALVPFTFRQLGQLHEILDRLRNSFAEQTDLYSTRILITDFDIKPYLKI